MEVGIQVSSLKPLLTDERGLLDACQRMAAMGCRTVQLQWLDPAITPSAVAGALEQFALRSVSVQDLFVEVEANWDYYTGLNAATGGKWLCVSRIPLCYHSRSGLEDFAGQLRQMEKRLEKLGQRLCFHPVRDDYTAVPGLDAVAFLGRALPELELCIDLYHLNRCGWDMPAYLRQWSGRVPMVHFKDSRGGTLVPAGQGDTDWTGVAEACLDAGTAYAFVEQEQWQGDPYPYLSQAMSWTKEQLRLSGLQDSYLK